MNLNDYPEELIEEEKYALDQLIKRMDRVIQRLEERMQKYVKEAKDANISLNPDSYSTHLAANNSKVFAGESKKKIQRGRDELYHTRLLLQYESEGKKGFDEIKVGLHSCSYGAEIFVTSWTMPVCRHYLLDKASTEYEGMVEGKHGEEYYTKFKLLVKNEVTLRFTHVIKVLNMYPGIFDDKTLKLIKNSGFFRDSFLDAMISRFNPDTYDPESAAKIISDEFLQELLERRSTPEFKNIVFSIQKKQGEIIQAPYKKSMIVQGCAGSGKSMIMLHRLPILLYDNPNSLKRTNLYIITPSQMYIQLAENMRYQLEISDINMGTLEQYFDYCIEKYPGHKSGEYGKISRTSTLKPSEEKYIYSEKCVSDIKEFIESKISGSGVSLEEAYHILNLQKTEYKNEKTYAQIINHRVLEYQKIIRTNETVIFDYFSALVDAIDAMNELADSLQDRKDRTLEIITRNIGNLKKQIKQAEKSITKLDPDDDSVEIFNLNSSIEAAQNKIDEYGVEIVNIDNDKEYFDSLSEFGTKIHTFTDTFNNINKRIEDNTMEDLYSSISKIGQLIGGYYSISWELSRTEDKYIFYIGSFREELSKTDAKISFLQGIKTNYLKYEYYSNISNANNLLSDAGNNLINQTYEFIMDKVGVHKSESGRMRALTCSPYLYLQAIYQIQGVPPKKKESLLAIDEAQGISAEEYKLLKKINGNDVIFNLFGDIHQHIEGTKGIDKWSEVDEIVDYDLYEMQENYRNASQITEYCNKTFGMQMNAINTPGKGVHEIDSEEAFYDEMVSQLKNHQRAGLSAIIVGDKAEAKYLLKVFANNKQKFHDMTDEEYSIHNTRWNIIHINDAKGLEFSSVIVLAGRMSRNQKYIAYTRALDDLYVYENKVEIEELEVKPSQRKTKEVKTSEKIEENKSEEPKNIEPENRKQSKHSIIVVSQKNHSNSEVRRFFESKGLNVIDQRDVGGRLWVIGEKEEIQDYIREAVSKFNISGKYVTSNKIKNRQGWCTKSDK